MKPGRWLGPKYWKLWNVAASSEYFIYYDVSQGPFEIKDIIWTLNVHYLLCCRHVGREKILLFMATRVVMTRLWNLWLNASFHLQTTLVSIIFIQNGNQICKFTSAYEINEEIKFSISWKKNHSLLVWKRNQNISVTTTNAFDIKINSEIQGCWSANTQLQNQNNRYDCLKSYGVGTHN